jgi:dimethylhistidine N-methyltransferase
MNAAFSRGVRVGLTRQPKRLEPKWLYDGPGAELFVRITQLDEYYPTRAEHDILAQHQRAIVAALGRGVRLVDLGSGDGHKAAVLLEALREPAAYAPVDLSREMLHASVEASQRRFPALPVTPICADFTAPFALPAAPASRTCIYFPGATIGNLEPEAATELLARLRALAGPDGQVLVAFDLKKEPAVLHRAYNDAQGVTAAFNLNLLARINRELGGDFELSAFHHYAFYDAHQGRIEMQLVSARAQSVTAAGARFDFAEGEPLTTEYSYKYTPAEFAALAVRAGLRSARAWLDARGWFSLQLFSAAAA